ncbi:MAG TPA: type 4a pilus biogenesis protein PilO [Meiothermus sp.]|nr:type 4a pilus biogenesis protein PilO [Meiothermus sp.]
MLARLGQREWSLIAIVAAILVGVLWFYLIVQPLRQQAEFVRLGSNGETVAPTIPVNGPLPEDLGIDDLQAARDRGRQAQAALGQLRNTIAELEARQQQFLRELPPQERLADVLASLAQQARQSGVTVRSIQRSPVAQTDVPNVRSVNLALQLDSPFSELYVFLRRLEELQRFSTISGLNLSLGGTAEQTANPPINTSLTMTVYVYQEPGNSAQTRQGSNPSGNPAQGQGGRP